MSDTSFNSDTDDRTSWDGELSAAQRDGQLSVDARRALAHIRGRTVSGRFANQLYDMPDERWQTALDELRHSGYRIEWTHGTIADDPTVTGGWRLAEHDHRASLEQQASQSVSDYRSADGEWIVACRRATRRVREAMGRDTNDDGLGLEL